MTALDRVARRVAAVSTRRTTAMPATAALTLRKPCGETLCESYYMCSDHDFRCYPCHDYCEDTSNNFDAHICEQQCQDYIHDFIRHYAKNKQIEEVLNEFQYLKSLMICMTLLVIIALVFISFTLIFIWKREKRIRKIKNSSQDSFFKKKLASLQYLKKKDKQQSAAAAVNTVSETVDNKMAATCTQTDLTAVAVASAAAGCDASSSASASSSAGQRTNTSSAGGASNSSESSYSNKLPCEDATLEFVGYDNFALKVSPVLPGKTTPPATAMPDDRGLAHPLRFTP